MSVKSPLVVAANKVEPAVLSALIERERVFRDVQYTFELLYSRDIGPNTVNKIWDLFVTNMRDILKTSSFGWNTREKRAELFHRLSRFILVRDSAKNNELVAFSIFRFDTEETWDDVDEEVLYCYEMQVSPTCQRSGLGAALMKDLEMLGTEYNMKKVMLTALRSNHSAWDFYFRLGFVEDPISPGVDFDYGILSKNIPSKSPS